MKKKYSYLLLALLTITSTGCIIEDSVGRECGDFPAQCVTEGQTPVRADSGVEFVALYDLVALFLKVFVRDE